MFRRSFLGTLSAVLSLPLIPGRVRKDKRQPVPSEGNLMFWFHFYEAIKRDRPMSTEWAREKTVEELNLQNLTEEEAVRHLELANEGVYDTDDVPERWRTLFEKMEQEL